MSPLYSERLGAIWCDWRRKAQSSKFKVQSSKSGAELEGAKIAGSGRPPARLNPVGSLFSLLLGLIGFDWVPPSPSLRRDKLIGLDPESVYERNGNRR
jgi:hypothetical protein